VITSLAVTSKSFRRRGKGWKDQKLHDALIRVYDDAGNLIETHEHKGDFKEAL
jgi:hypothetical protein